MACLQVGMLGERLAFLVEWLDSASGITWRYQLLQYPESHEIEMVSPLATLFGGPIAESLTCSHSGAYSLISRTRKHSSRRSGARISPQNCCTSGPP